MVTTPGVTRRIFVIGRIACILVIPAVVLHLGSAEFLPINVARLEGAGVYLATFSVSRFIKKVCTTTPPVMHMRLLAERF